MPSPIIAALDPEHSDDAPLMVAAALSRVTGAPLIALSAYLHDSITNAVSAGSVDEDLRADALQALERRAGAAVRISWSAAGRRRRASSTTLPPTWTRASSWWGRPGAGGSGASCPVRRRSDCCTAPRAPWP